MPGAAFLELEGSFRDADITERSALSECAAREANDDEKEGEPEPPQPINPHGTPRSRTQLCRRVWHKNLEASMKTRLAAGSAGAGKTSVHRLARSG